jgi:hypothetical protein
MYNHASLLEISIGIELQQWINLRNIVILKC